jgi:hypothetical protein
MALASPVAAVDRVPDSAGWRGFFIAGAGHLDLRSNLVAGNSLIDVGRPVVSSIDQRPRSDTTLHPVFTGEVTYTFESGWQAFLGTALEDAVTLDAVTQFGVRRNLSDSGTVQAGVLFSGIQTEAWEDPYAEGIAREETDRDSTGVRLQWDRVLGSAFELTFSYREISFDTERSGQGVTSVDCDSTCQSLLRRDGDQYSFDVAYLYRLGADRNHLVRPSIRYTVDDREGAAVAADGYRLQVAYAYIRPPYTLTSNILYGRTTRDERSPLFGVRTDVDRFAVDATVLYRLPAAGGRWQAVANILWGQEDSDVRFHDNRLFMVSVGAMYRFGAP